MTFEEYYQNIGLVEYPFTTFTTELELDRAKDLFVPMTEYGPILESFKNKISIILLGERGVGKTAVLEEFHRQTSRNQVYSVIKNFNSIPIEATSKDFYNLILQNLVISFIDYLTKKPFFSLRINKRGKILLSYLIYFYSDELTLQTIKDSIDKIQIPFYKRLVVNIYNHLRSPLNYIGTIVENGLKRYIAQNFKVIPFYDEKVIHEYFPEIIFKTDISFREGIDSFRLIKELCEMIREQTTCKPTVLFDKLDEDQRLANDAELISQFILPLLSDNNLLSLDSLQSIIFIWKTPYRYIEDRVRSQKYLCPTIKWDTDTLKNVLNKRLSIFSNNKLTNYSVFFKGIEEDLINELFALANGVPRDLWHLMSILFEEQFRINPKSLVFEKRSIEKAKKRFVTEFNYYEYYPRKINARRDSMDIYSYYAHLRKVGSPEFTKNKLNELAGTGGSTNNYVVGMERIGLIERIRQDRGEILFGIKDNKIVFAIRNNLELRYEASNYEFTQKQGQEEVSEQPKVS